MTASPKHALFLSGPIGVGKTTLGRALSASIGSGFIDGDDHSDPDKPWYCSILRTSIAMVETGFAVLESKPAVVIAYPLTCINWIYFRRKFGDASIRTLFISLRATFASIVDEGRGRRFDEDEQRRIRIMIAEGYGARPFSDLIVDTDQDSFQNTLVHLASETQRMMRTN
jgi:hypothetical protein